MTTLVVLCIAIQEPQTAHDNVDDASNSQRIPPPPPSTKIDVYLPVGVGGPLYRIGGTGYNASRLRSARYAGSVLPHGTMYFRR